LSLFPDIVLLKSAEAARKWAFVQDLSNEQIKQVLTSTLH
jgi:hypothetical protein